VLPPRPARTRVPKGGRSRGLSGPAWPGLTERSRQPRAAAGPTLTSAVPAHGSAPPPDVIRRRRGGRYNAPCDWRRRRRAGQRPGGAERGRGSSFQRSTAPCRGRRQLPPQRPAPPSGVRPGPGPPQRPGTPPAPQSPGRPQRPGTPPALWDPPSPTDLGRPQYPRTPPSPRDPSVLWDTPSPLAPQDTPGVLVPPQSHRAQDPSRALGSPSPTEPRTPTEPWEPPQPHRARGLGGEGPFSHSCRAFKTSCFCFNALGLLGSPTSQLTSVHLSSSAWLLRMMGGFPSATLHYPLPHGSVSWPAHEPIK